LTIEIDKNQQQPQKYSNRPQEYENIEKMGKHGKKNNKKTHQTPSSPRKTQQLLHLDIYQSPTEPNNDNLTVQGTGSGIGYDDPGPPVSSLTTIDLINQAMSLFLPNLPTSTLVSAPSILPMSAGVTDPHSPLSSAPSMASQGLALARGTMSALFPTQCPL
jgi:hypothetical protein